MQNVHKLNFIIFKTILIKISRIINLLLILLLFEYDGYTEIQY